MKKTTTEKVIVRGAFISLFFLISILMSVSAVSATATTNDVASASILGAKVSNGQLYINIYDSTGGHSIGVKCPGNSPCPPTQLLKTKKGSHWYSVKYYGLGWYHASVYLPSDKVVRKGFQIVKSKKT